MERLSVAMRLLRQRHKIRLTQTPKNLLRDEAATPISVRHAVVEKSYRSSTAQRVQAAVRRGLRHRSPTLTATAPLAEKRNRLVQQRRDRVPRIIIIRIREYADRLRIADRRVTHWIQTRPRTRINEPHVREREPSTFRSRLVIQSPATHPYPRFATLITKGLYFVSKMVHC